MGETGPIHTMQQTVTGDGLVEGPLNGNDGSATKSLTSLKQSMQDSMSQIATTLMLDRTFNRHDTGDRNSAVGPSPLLAKPMSATESQDNITQGDVVKEDLGGGVIALIDSAASGEGLINQPPLIADSSSFQLAEGRRNTLYQAAGNPLEASSDDILEDQNAYRKS